MEKSVITKLYNQGIKMIRLMPNLKKPYSEGTFTGEPLKDLITHKGNIGVVGGEISKLVILDVDVHTGDGYAELKEVMGKNTLPDTYSVKTPTGGLHYYFRLSSQWNGTRFNQKLHTESNLDFQTNGRYVVAESSYLNFDKENGEHVEGFYTINSGSPDYIAYAPEWLLNLYMKDIDPKYNKPRQLNALGAFVNLWGMGMKEDVPNFNIASINKMCTSGVTLKAIKRLAWYVNMTSVKDGKDAFEEAYNDIFEPIKQNGITLERVNKLGEFLNMWYQGAGEGGRNIYMTQMLGRLFASGCNFDYVHDIGRVINRTACNPPLDQFEFNQTYESMLKTEKRRLEDLKRRLEQ